MVRRARLHGGDVFSVPLGDGRCGVGQVVGRYGKDAYFFAMFDVASRCTDPLDIDAAMRSRVLFLALSFDAKLAVGHWTVVDNRPVSCGNLLPAYKEAVGTAHEIDVVDYSGERRRKATSAEAEILPNRKIVAPVRLEKALKAKFGLEPWDEIYSDLAPDENRTTDRLFR